MGIYRNSAMRSLDFLRPCTSLAQIDLVSWGNVVDLTPLTDSPVTSLVLLNCTVARIDDLKSLTQLKDLSLDMELPSQNLEALPSDADLTSLTLGNVTCEHLSTLEGIARWPGLTKVVLSGPVDGLSHLAQLHNLHHLVLQYRARPMLEQLPPTPQIRKLVLDQGWATEDRQLDLAVVRRVLPHLKELMISCFGGCRRVDLTALRDMPDLTIRLYGATEVAGTEHFPPDAIIRTPRPRT